MTKGQRTALLEVIAGLSLIVATSIGASSILNRIDRKLHNTAQLNAAEAEESYTTIRNLVVLLFGVTGVLATALYAAFRRAAGTRDSSPHLGPRPRPETD